VMKAVAMAIPSWAGTARIIALVVVAVSTLLVAGEGRPVTGASPTAFANSPTVLRSAGAWRRLRMGGSRRPAISMPLRTIAGTSLSSASFVHPTPPPLADPAGNACSNKAPRNLWRISGRFQRAGACPLHDSAHQHIRFGSSRRQRRRVEQVWKWI
jgi:hypothetical protein